MRLIGIGGLVMTSLQGCTVAGSLAALGRAGLSRCFFCGHRNFPCVDRNENACGRTMFPEGESVMASNSRSSKAPARNTRRRKPKAAGKLAKYQSMRDFSRTAEPSGRRAVAGAEQLRFVVQKHAATRLHYDFRLEWDGTFKSWAVTRGPSLNPADKRLAVEVEDHPLDYGDFEGTIPKGQYGGGTVMIWDRGYWIPEGAMSPQDALAKGDLKFSLDGRKLHGSWVLVRMKGDRFGGKRTNWLLIKHKDDDARPGEGESVLAQDRSVASNRSLDAIAAGKGRAPKPFMLPSRKAARADAVWHSNRPEEAE